MDFTTLSETSSANCDASRWRVTPGAALVGRGGNDFSDARLHNRISSKT